MPASTASRRAYRGVTTCRVPADERTARPHIRPPPRYAPAPGAAAELLAQLRADRRPGGGRRSSRSGRRRWRSPPHVLPRRAVRGRPGRAGPRLLRPRGRRVLASGKDETGFVDQHLLLRRPPRAGDLTDGPTGGPRQAVPSATRGSFARVPVTRRVREPGLAEHGEPGGEAAAWNSGRTGSTVDKGSDTAGPAGQYRNSTPRQVHPASRTMVRRGSLTSRVSKRNVSTLCRRPSAPRWNSHCRYTLKPPRPYC